METNNKYTGYKVLLRYEELTGDRYRGAEHGRFCECQLMRDFIEQVDHEYIARCDDTINRIDKIKRLISFLYPEIIIPEGTETFPHDTFEFWGKSLGFNKENYSGLKYIFIPGSIKRIEFFTFYHNDNLEELVLSEGIEIIEKNAFSNCKIKKPVIIPDSVKEIDDTAFEDCEATIVVPDAFFEKLNGHTGIEKIITNYISKSEYEKNMLLKD